MRQIRNEDNFVCPCIVCDKEIVAEFPQHPEVNNPKDATFFKTYGNYGSGHFDSLGHAYLEINVCDDCMSKAISRGNVVLCAVDPDPSTSLEKDGYYVWDGSGKY